LQTKFIPLVRAIEVLVASNDYAGDLCAKHLTEKEIAWMLHFFENGSLGLPFCTKVSTTIITGYQHFDLVETRRFLTSSYESNRNTRLAD